MTPASDPNINTTPPASCCFIIHLFGFLDHVVVICVMDPDDLKLAVYEPGDQIIGEMNCNACAGRRRILCPL